MISKCTLGSPLREIRTMGSERGDEYKRPRPLGEGTDSKESADSEAPQRATASRLVPTHHAPAKLGAFSGCNSHTGKGKPPHRESSLGLMEVTT